MKPLQVTMYIYSNKEKPGQLHMYRCLRCGRPLFRSSSDKIVISNAYGASWQDHPPGSNYIEHQCHSCKTLYQILFQ